MTLRQALQALACSESIQNGFYEPWLDREFEQEADDLSFDPDLVAQNARFCSLPETTVDAMLTAVRSAAPEVRLTAKMIFRCVFRDRESRPWAYQTLDLVCREYADALHLVIAAGFVPLIRAFHARANVSENITRDTCLQVLAYHDNHITGTGRIGIYQNQLSWMHHYLDPEKLYLRLGRFEFMTRKYHNGHVYRRKSDGSLVIFAIPGIQFDRMGYAVESRPDSPERAFTSVYCEDAGLGTATGSPVGPNGRTSAEPLTIRLADYDLVLGEGMPVLEMHIPSGGGMTPDESERSFRLAKEFYSTLPDRTRHPVAVICSSWIFNPNLPEILPPESNLVRLLKRVHPVPRTSSTTDGLWFIFRQEGAFELLKAPRKTSLQRAVTRFIENGGRWRVGGMILLMSEIGL